MEVQIVILDLKRDFDNRIESLNLLGEVIARSVESQTIRACAKSFVVGQQLSAPTVGVRLRGCQRAPFSGGLSPLEPYRYAFRRPALSNVENVG